MTLSAHQPLNDALDHEHASMGASEVHGLLCGLICAHGEAGSQRYLPMIFDTAAGKSEALRSQLADLGDESRNALIGVDFEFNLLLPDDDTPIALRFEALISWCQGFMLGLLLDKPERMTILSADAQEATEDLMEISAGDPVVDEDDMAGEQDLAGIIEHVRVSVQLIHDDLDHWRSIADS
ncbi:MAG: UPF0149 family protein [Acidiferrobacteraceae bacterium]